jgi:hypothetical protein
MFELSSSKTITTSGVIGDSGQPQILYGFTVKSGGTAGVLTVKNGSSATGTAIFGPTGTVNQEILFVFPIGTLLGSGIYASFDANVTGATVFFKQLLTA